MPIGQMISAYWKREGVNLKLNYPKISSDLLASVFAYVAIINE